MSHGNEIAALDAELERRRVEAETAALTRELGRRKVFAHIRTVYPGPEGDDKCDLLQRTVYDNQWIPDKYKTGLTPKQGEFLVYEGRECLYGGSAGGGKSISALIGATQYVDDPGYHALILRRTYKQLAKADSILNVSKEWFYGKVKWNGDNYTWTFPSGATIEFGHMEGPNDHLNYQGAVFQFVCYDELTQFGDEQQYTFLFTRLRRPLNSKLPIRMRATSNPGGPGHSLVFNRFINPESKRPESHFIPAKLDDNPNLDRAEYVEAMAAVDPLMRRRMLDGDWSAVEGGRYKPEWLRKYWKWDAGRHHIVLTDGRGEYKFPAASAPTFVTCDPASSSKRTADFTVFGVWKSSPRGDLVWLDCIRRQVDIPDQPKLLQEVYDKHQFHLIGIEAVASNQSMYQFAERLGMHPARLTPKGNDKLAHAQNAIIAAEAGRVWLPAPGMVDGLPHADIEAELTSFTGTKDDTNDDICDVVSYAVDFQKKLHYQLTPCDRPGSYDGRKGRR